MNKKLPKAPKGAVALPEGAFWLLVTGQEPTEEEVPFFWEMFCRKKEGWKHYQKGFGWIILAFWISVDAFGILWCLGMNWFSVPKLTLRDAFGCLEKMVSANLNTMAWRFAQWNLPKHGFYFQVGELQWSVWEKPLSMQGSQQEKGPHDLVGLSMDRGLPPRSGEVIIMYMLFQMHLVVFWNNTGDFVGISDHIHMFPSKLLAKKQEVLPFYWSIYPFHGDLWRLDPPPPWEVKGLTQEFHKRSALPANVPRNNGGWGRSRKRLVEYPINPCMAYMYLHGDSGNAWNS